MVLRTAGNGVRWSHHGVMIEAPSGWKGTLAVRKPGPATVFGDFEDGSITELGHSLQVAVQHVMPS